MEKVRFACPRCQTIMQTGAEKVGYDVACPHCAHRFRLVESGDPTSAGQTNTPTTNDAPTIPPTSLKNPYQRAGVDSSGGFRTGSSGSVDVPYTGQPSPGAFDSSKPPPVVSQYPHPARGQQLCTVFLDRLLQVTAHMLRMPSRGPARHWADLISCSLPSESGAH